MSDDVREIVGRAKRGDTAAMRRLVELYGPRSFLALPSRMLGQREDAEDAAWNVGSYVQEP
ncbi:MAG: hypothetical protein R3B96_16445 [Pirellulaceae bacterium]